MVASAGRPLRMADIAAGLEVVPRSVTTMVDGVEAAGLIVRSSDPEDRRSVLVSLTPRGHALLGRLERARRASAEEVFGSLAGPERSDLARLLGALCRHDGCSSCAGPPHDTHAHGHPHGHSHGHAGPGHAGHRRPPAAGEAEGQGHRAKPGPAARRKGES
jgi:DNA-binding MarR family transcriptional regulator